jgi:Mycothiol maleylpyruvate isomerase N-terminal domain
MDATLYLESATAAAALIASPEVAARWDEPSALREMPVSGLAGHLARQITRVPGQLSRREPLPEGTEVITVLDHYARVQWIDAPLDAAVNVGIRDEAGAEAEGGPGTLADRAATAIARLTTMLPAEDPDQPCYLPWTGWALSLSDFLTTRMLEIVIHVDDLAVSVGVPPPPLPEQATEAVIGLLTRLSARRHGTAAVLRALSRAERAPATIAAF